MPEHEKRSESEPASEAGAIDRATTAPATGMLDGAAAGLGGGLLQRKIQRRAAARGDAQPAAAAKDTTDEATVTPETDDKDKAKDKGKDKKEVPAIKSEISADVGFKILKDAFGGLKKDVSQGKVQVLGQADFQVAYDVVYGKTDYSWDKYIKPRFGNVRGFAHEGTNYINKDEPSIDVGTVVHEMLHNNTASDWTGVVGNQFNEGTTEFLTVIAMKKAGKPRASGYAKQLDIVNHVVGAGLGEDTIKSAYLLGGAQKSVADWFTAAMVSSWTDFRADMQNEDYAKAKLKIKKKTAEAAKK